MISLSEWSAATAPTLEEFEAIADEAYQAIPAVLRSRVDAVIIRVEDFADDDTLRDLGLESPYELSGLYRGVDLTRKSIADSPTDVDMIFLYRLAILDEWAYSGETLGGLIRHVLIHEIGHHFGYSDDDIDAINDEQGD